MAAEIALDISMEVGSQHKEIEISVSKRRKYMTMSIAKSTTPYEQYAGPYTVDASFYYEKTLETGGKLMAQNVKVNTIPVYDVSNPQGGKTITIGVS